MVNYTEPYKDIDWSNNKFSKEDVKYIYHLFFNDNKSKMAIAKLTNLSYHYVGRIITSIENGSFDDILYDGFDLSDEFEDELGNIINIYDGINIEIHNHYDSKQEVKPKKKPKGNLNAWSKRIRERDGFTCVVCDKYSKQHMEAHHIIPKSIDPSQATNDLNGVCICQSCHRKYNNQYEPKNQNAVTFARFIANERRGY